MLLDDIKTSVSQMTNDELMERIKELRAARRIESPNKTKAKKSTKSTSTKKLSTDQIINSMSADELAELLKQLEEGA